MKHAKKALALMILLVTPLLLSGVIAPTTNTGVKTTLDQTPIKVSLPSYETITPILAFSDFDMDNYASALSWDGNGSPDTPYILDGYNITSDGTCIEIRNTIRAFEIRNCYLSSISGSDGTGIQISNVTQAAIVDTFVLNKFWSFDITDTPAPYIENCTIHDSYLIYLGNCTGATITECDVYDNANDGIYLYECNNSLVSNNEIFGNGGQGLLVESSDFLTITTNTFARNGDEGISLHTCNNATIRDNDVWENDFPGSIGGVYLEAGLYNLIEANRIWNNSEIGIYIDDSEHVEISSNHIYNNTDYGIYGEMITLHQYLTIEDNVIHDNGITGVYLDGYDDSIIANNQIYNHADSGLDFYGNRNEVIGNEVYNCETGISSYECYNNTYSENVVYLCLGGIYIVNIGSNITDNIVYDNEYGIYMDNSGNCSIYGNDIGWNTVNAYERYTFPDMPLMWYNNITEVGNWWHNYNYTGFYNITTDTGIDSQDLFPSKSLELSQATPLSFEILETGNMVIWEAYALNPSFYEIFVDGVSVLVEDWYGGNIEFLVDGFAHGTYAIDVIVYHISGHSMGNDTTADVEDLTPPDIDGPSHIVITVGEAVSEQYTAEDPSGIGSWAVNDTVNFAVDSSGFLTSVTDLPVGEYTVRITVSDTHGHSTYHDATIMVNAVPGLPPTAMLMIVAGGGIVVLVVLIIGYKTKRG